ncbi:Hypothetical predicted protein [Podarcis lilfordi]|uniref:Uncharacterized protein n=1 Tax=Podarcis lilfordi TaxID=74358 RepID=A0AA35PPJ7_9SAUR|nr:Hypothetical predicted protein [Podarcis lilfordi]
MVRSPTAHQHGKPKEDHARSPTLQFLPMAASPLPGVRVTLTQSSHALQECDFPDNPRGDANGTSPMGM